MLGLNSDILVTLRPLQGHSLCQCQHSSVEPH